MAEKDAEEEKMKCVPEVLQWFRQLKQDVCCRRCGLMHAAVIEFHHVSKEDKRHTVSHMVHSGFPLEEVKEELSRTVPLCKNCHSIVHFNQDHGYKDSRWPHDEGFHVA